MITIRSTKHQINKNPNFLTIRINQMGAVKPSTYDKLNSNNEINTIKFLFSDDYATHQRYSYNVLLAIIKKKSKIKEIYLLGNESQKISVYQVFKDIMAMINANTNINHVAVENFRLETDVAKELAAFIKANKHLSKLTLNINILNQDLFGLIQTLKENKTIKELILHKGFEVTSDYTQSTQNSTILDVIRENKSIDTLSMMMTNSSLKDYAEAIKENQTIKHLILQSSRDSEADEMTTLIDILRHNPRLQTLDISDWIFSRSKGDSTLFDFFQELSQYPIKKLDISHHPIDIEEGKNLAIFLKENKTLEEINLAWCKLQDQTLDDMAKILNENITLKKLNLYGNQITTVLELYMALENNNSLEEIDIQLNPICNKTDVQDLESSFLSNALQRNTSLKSFQQSAIIPSNQQTRLMAINAGINKTLNTTYLVDENKSTLQTLLNMKKADTQHILVNSVPTLEDLSIRKIKSAIKDKKISLNPIKKCLSNQLLNKISSYGEPENNNSLQVNSGCRLVRFFKPTEIQENSKTETIYWQLKKR